MKSQAVSLKPTKTLELPSTKVFDEQPTSTAPRNVIFAEFPVPAKPLSLPGAIDIDDLVAEFDRPLAAVPDGAGQGLRFRGAAEAFAGGRRRFFC